MEKNETIEDGDYYDSCVLTKRESGLKLECQKKKPAIRVHPLESINKKKKVEKNEQ